MSQKWSGYARHGTIDDEPTEVEEAKKLLKKDADWLYQSDSFCKTAKSMLAEEDRRTSMLRASYGVRHLHDLAMSGLWSGNTVEDKLAQY